MYAACAIALVPDNTHFTELLQTLYFTFVSPPLSYLLFTYYLLTIYLLFAAGLRGCADGRQRVDARRGHYGCLSLRLRLEHSTVKQHTDNDTKGHVYKYIRQRVCVCVHVCVCVCVLSHHSISSRSSLRQGQKNSTEQSKGSVLTKATTTAIRPKDTAQRRYFNCFFSHLANRLLVPACMRQHQGIPRFSQHAQANIRWSIRRARTSKLSEDAAENTELICALTRIANLRNKKKSLPNRVYPRPGLALVVFFSLFCCLFWRLIY